MFGFKSYVAKQVSWIFHTSVLLIYYRLFLVVVFHLMIDIRTSQLYERFPSNNHHIHYLQAYKHIYIQCFSTQASSPLQIPSFSLQYLKSIINHPPSISPTTSNPNNPIQPPILPRIITFKCEVQAHLIVMSSMLILFPERL